MTSSSSAAIAWNRSGETNLPTSYPHLPNDIWGEILKHIPVLQLRNVRAVCTRFNVITKGRFDLGRSFFQLGARMANNSKEKHSANKKIDFLHIKIRLSEMKCHFSSKKSHEQA